MKTSEVPKFGPLSGIRVVSCGISVAGPYGGAMMADFGADVIFIESPMIKDHFRTTDSPSYINKERRNQRAMVLNMAKPEGKEAFLKLIKTADIFIENSKAGQWDRRGLSDEVLWGVNPKLVISHVSGFGLTGDPEYLARGAYDSIGQAISGYMNINGNPEPEPPTQAPAYAGDYFCAMLSSWACLAAYIKAQQTGKGESIDCAQFEALHTVQAGFQSDWLNYKFPRKRAGASNPSYAGCQTYKCKDGWIYVFFLSLLTHIHGLPLFGLKYGTPEYPEGQYCTFKGTPAGDELHKRITEFCASRTIMEAEKELVDHHITANAVLSYEQMEDHPHYKARGVFTEWEGIQGDMVKGPAVIPRLKNNPGKIWKAAPHYGADNNDILKELGYTDEQIKKFYDMELIKKDEVINPMWKDMHGKKK
ncbi:MAG: L-carnitine CoA-transferase [Smithellaceae bacterium]